MRLLIDVNIDIFSLLSNHISLFLDDKLSKVLQRIYEYQYRENAVLLISQTLDTELQFAITGFWRNWFKDRAFIFNKHNYVCEDIDTPPNTWSMKSGLQKGWQKGKPKFLRRTDISQKAHF